MRDQKPLRPLRYQKSNSLLIYVGCLTHLIDEQACVSVTACHKADQPDLRLSLTYVIICWSASNTASRKRLRIMIMVDSNRVAVLRHVYDVAGQAETSRTLAVQAIKDAGGDLEDVKFAFQCGIIGAACGITMDEAYRQRALPGHLTTGDGEKRTAAAEKAYATARQTWGRALGDLGLKKESAKKGAKPAKPSAPIDAPADAPIVAEGLLVPTLASAAEIQTYLATLATHMMQLQAKNANAFTGDLGSHLREAIKLFGDDVASAGETPVNLHEVSTKARVRKGAKAD